MKRKLFILPITLTALTPMVNIVGCGNRDQNQITINLVASTGGSVKISSYTIDKGTKFKDIKAFLDTQVEADESYEFVCWCNQNEQPLESDYTFNDSETIIAQFDKKEITINLTASTGGSVKISSYTIARSTKFIEVKDFLDAQVEANDGYAFVCWYNQNEQPLEPDYVFEDGEIITSRFEHFTASDYFEWNYDKVNKTASLSELSPKGSTETKIIIPSNIYGEDGESYRVTSILNNAFEESDSMSLVTIPKEIVFIGDSAFDGCENLKTVIFSSGSQLNSFSDEIFRYCMSLTSIIIPNSVISIGNYAFLQCISLTSITIPSSVTSLGDNDVFGGCPSLTSINVDPDNTKYTSRDLSGKECNCIVDTSNSTLMYGCQNTEIPSNIICINKNAFLHCWNLTSIEIPNSVTSIGDSAFKSCFGLSSINIPSSVTSIGEVVFYNCLSLTSINVDPDNTKYTSRDLSGKECNCIVDTSNSTLMYGCQNTEIPNDIVSINEYCFADCINLTSIAIPGSVTLIDNFAFAGCMNLAEIDLTSLISPPTLGASVFKDCSDELQLVVAKNMGSVFKEAEGWSEYADHIIEVE